MSSIRNSSSIRSSSSIYVEEILAFHSEERRAFLRKRHKNESLFEKKTEKQKGASSRVSP